jgi:hypothetical protein
MPPRGLADIVHVARIRWAGLYRRDRASGAIRPARRDARELDDKPVQTARGGPCGSRFPGMRQQGCGFRRGRGGNFPPTGGAA